MDGSGGGGGRIALVERRHQRLQCLHQASVPGRGGAERLAALLRTLLDDRRLAARTALGLIAAVVGPGSFTGLRATLALAQGLALGAGLPLQGVTTGEALRRTCRSGSIAHVNDMPLWCVGMARRDRVFLERDEREGPHAFMIDALPIPLAPVLLAGDASDLAAARIAARGGVARIAAWSNSRMPARSLPSPSTVSRPRRSTGGWSTEGWSGRLARAALPLYVDPPEARPPAAGLRPAPV